MLELLAIVLFVGFIWFLISLANNGSKRQQSGAVWTLLFTFLAVGSGLLGGYFWFALGALVLGVHIYISTKNSLEQERKEREGKN
ncbi:hypothetical protein V1291_005036 [Nitrobacteraceae bacterium AZCC 1564]